MDLNIHLVSVDYCPICGKGLFGKKYIESLDKDDLFEFMKQDERFPIWSYKCNRCKSKFTIEIRGMLKDNSQKKNATSGDKGAIPSPSDKSSSKHRNKNNLNKMEGKNGNTRINT